MGARRSVFIIDYVDALCVFTSLCVIVSCVDAQMLCPNAGMMLKERGIVEEIVNAGTLDEKG